MRECQGCGKPVLDQYEEGFLRDLPDSTAIGRRILAGFCWVCTRLRSTVAKEMASITPLEDVDPSLR